MHTKYCPRCGTKLASNAKFCTNCGYRFKNIDNPSQVHQDTRSNSNQDIKSNNNQVKHSSYHNHQGLWVVIVIIILILGLGGYAVYNQKSNDYGNNVSKVNKKSKSFSKSEAQSVLSSAWGSYQNEINQGVAEDNDNIPMDTSFTSDNNKDYKEFLNSSKHLHQETKQSHKKVHIYIKVVSKSPISHRKCKVKYKMKSVIAHTKPFSEYMTATFKLTSSGGGEWSISHMQDMSN